MSNNASVQDVNTFIEHVLRLIRYNFAEVGLSRLGINTPDQKAQLGKELQMTLMEFKRTYVENDLPALRAHAQTLHGQFEVSRTLSALTENETTQLHDSLDNLVKE